MARFKRKINWKSILSATLAVVILVGCAAGITALVRKDTKTISSLSFKRGELNAEGDYVETNEALFTEEMFECMGLVIETDVKFTDEFKVFYYNYDGVFLSSSDVYTKTTRLEIPELAKYARVVIYLDEEAKWNDVYKHAKLLDIKVDKDQNFALYDHFKIDEEHPNVQVTWANTHQKVNYENYVDGWSPCTPINVSGWNNLVLIFDDSEDNKDLVYFFTSGTGDTEMIVPAGSVQKRLNGGLTEVIIEVPEGAETFYTNTLTDAKHHYVINQYN